MGKPSKPFERYRTRSALFLMMYGITALIFGIPNISIVSPPHDSRIVPILITSILVVSRFIGYVKIAGFALLDAEHIRMMSSRISFTISVIAIIILANAAYFLYQFGFSSMPVNAVSAGCIFTSAVLVFHLLGSIGTGLTRSRLMRMVSNVLIILGCADICISLGTLDYGPAMYFLVSPFIGIMTLFFGIYTERKSMSLALKQTLAATTGSFGAGFAVYYLRWYLDPSMISMQTIPPPFAVMLGLVVTAVGIGYYFWSRRVYASGSPISAREKQTM